MKPFDIADPLPTGTTILEASAGTGKTYTVGALVTRYVAEGQARLEEMLVVTFGRVASLELRQRVRGQLVAAERGLADPAAARASGDQLLRLLADADDDEVLLRRRRIATALADFDAATIATTHQFCQQVLAGLGVAGDSEPGATLVESLDDLVVEVVDDLYVRGFARSDSGQPFFDRSGALELGRAVMNNPQARLEPESAVPGSVPARRRTFAAAVRTEVDRRKRRNGLLGYDDLLGRLAGALGPQDAAARARMRDRWKVVLVDEFQDTDPVQWEVLERAFAGAAVLILIGDPKQAIYAFRGGDVTTYLAAAGTAQTSATLEQNWRSDTPLVAALHAMIGDAALGDPRIVVRPVSADAHPTRRLSGAASEAPLRLRVVTRYQLGVGAGSGIPIAKARAHVADDLAADISRLLGSGARFDERLLAAGDVAVLVGTHHQATLVRAALTGRDVPAVIAGSGSVYATPAADDWLVLLEALEQPHRSGRVRAAALTPFLGQTATDLAEGGEGLTDELGDRLRTWADLLASRGVAALHEVATTDRGLLARLLGQVDGARRLTDLRHVGQGLHAASVEEGLGLAALVEWLRRRRAEAGEDGTAERTRRLDSDAAAVQVVTLHASKGLEYPVVYLPFGFDRWVPTPNVLLLHDDGARVLDVGGQGSPGRREREAQAAAELAGEALRVLYVGLTRAQSQVIMWWAPTNNTPSSGLHRVLFGREQGSSAIPDSTALVSDQVAAARLAELAARGGPVLEDAVPAAAAGSVLLAGAAPALAVGVFDRTLDTGWRRLSYSALAAAGEATTPPGVTSEPETGEREDEAVAVTPIPTADDGQLLDLPSPMAELPVGTAFGTLVHAILEHTDPAADDLWSELRERSREQLARRPAAVTSAALADALLPVLATPLGPLAGGLSLQDIGVRDRLAELDFELPLAGGDDHPSAGAMLADLAPLLRRHLAADDPLRSYADRVAEPEIGPQPLRGYLTGSLDAVLRLPGPRYLVVDYKTNWLGDVAGAPLSAWHYRPAALSEVMLRSHYPLQALLYSVALHRYLRWRQPAYDPEQHLGGLLYLYVRGMCGAATPLIDGHPCGVFSWRPPVALVEALSIMLDEGAA